MDPYLFTNKQRESSPRASVHPQEKVSMASDWLSEKLLVEEYDVLTISTSFENGGDGVTT
jgi:hypothetical protein